MVAMSKGPLADALALYATGARRTFEDKGHVLDLVPPPYLRPIGDETARMLDLPKRFPGLVEAEVIGHSVEGRPLVALHLSNFADPRPKPTIGLLGNLHGDEIGNGPWGMAVLEHALQGYGVDPAATALLNSRDIRAIPFANPDGRFRVEQGYLSGNVDDLFHRANANGVDLNRNFPFGYGTTTPTRGSAGPAAMSEPETQAIVGYWNQHVPDIYVDVHSKGEKILVPYGFDHPPSKDLPGMLAIGRGVGQRNGYKVESSATFTGGGTSGTSKDWMHGVHGVPSFTLEVGTTHHLTQQAFEDSVLRNTKAMSWLSRIADAPYARAAGPAVTSASRDARGGVDVIADPDGLRHAVAGVEVYADPLAAVGSGVRLQPHGSTWGADAGALAALGDARHGAGLLYSRAVDAAGNWGPFSVVQPAGRAAS